MNKFIAIAATAGLIAAFAGNAQAAPTPIVSLGNVLTDCTITTSTGGTLLLNAAKDQLDSSLSGGGFQGKVSVTCNTGTSILSLGATTAKYDSTPNAPNPAGALPTSHIPESNFNGGTGIYFGKTGVSIAATSSTASSDALIRSIVKVPVGSLIQAGSYSVEVPVTLVP